MAVYGINSTSKDVAYGPWDGHVVSGHRTHRTPANQVLHDEAQRLYRQADAYLDLAHDITVDEDQRMAYRSLWDELSKLAELLERKASGSQITGVKINAEMVTA